MVSSEHWRGTLARVRRFRAIWRCPENQRWDRKPLTEMNGELRNTSPRQEEKLQIKDRECIALKTTEQVWRSERKHDVLRACWIKSAGFESKNTGYCGQ